MKAARCRPAWPAPRHRRVQRSVLTPCLNVQARNAVLAPRRQRSSLRSALVVRAANAANGDARSWERGRGLPLDLANISEGGKRHLLCEPLQVGRPALSPGTQPVKNLSAAVAGIGAPRWPGEPTEERVAEERGGVFGFRAISPSGSSALSYADRSGISVWWSSAGVRSRRCAGGSVRWSAPSIRCAGHP